MSWVSIGPSSARRGQASTFPAISGRVSGIALPRHGQRVYIATANGGVWRSDDRGVTWRPLMDRFDRNPQVAVNPTSINNSAVGVDTLACGAIAIHPDHQDTIFVGTGEAAAFEGAAPFYFGAGVAVSTDAGLTWNIEEETTAQDGQPSTDMLGIGFYALVVDPTNKDIAVAATTRGLYVRQRSGAEYRWSQRRIRPDISGRDGSDVDVTSVVVASAGANPPVFYAATRGSGAASGQVYRSIDHGATWTPLGVFPPPGDPFDSLDGRVTLAVKHDDPNFLYARTSSGFIFRWNGTAANQWNSIANLPGDIADQGFYNLALAVDPANGERIFVGGATSLITRPDGERIWSAIFYRLTMARTPAGIPGDPDFIDTATTVALGSSMHADIHAIAFKPGDANEMWVGGDGGIFFTTTPQGAGNIFTQRNAGIGSLLTHKITSHPQHEAVIFAGAQDNGCLRYTGQESWYCSAHGDAGAIVINRRHPERLLIGYITNSLFHKSDAGVSNRNGSYSLLSYTLNEQILFYPPLVTPPAPANDAEADRVAWGAERIWLSDNFGTNFNALPTPAGRTILSTAAFSNANDSRIKCLTFGDQTHLFAGLMNGEIYFFTENPGAATPWPAPQRLDTQPGLVHNGNPIRQPITDIAADPRNVGACFITFGGFGDHPRVWYYDGASWHNRSGTNADANQNLMTVQLNCILVDAPADAAQPLRIYIGADIGCWRSLDAGITWELWATGLPDCAILDLDVFAPSRLIRAATFGRGLFERHLDDATRSVHLYVRDHQLDTGRIASNLAAANIDNPLGPANLAAIETATIAASQTAYNAAIAAGQTENQARLAELTAAQNMYTAQLAAAPANHVAAHSSPDMKTDAPDAGLNYQFASDECLEFLRFVDIFTDESQGLTYTDNSANVINRVYVQVHNRGSAWAHRIQVMLLIAVETGGAVPDLPEDFDYYVRRGTPVNRDGWRTVGLRNMSDLRAGHPRVTRFELSSDLLKELAGTGTPDLFQLLIILHHKDDPFASSTRVFSDLVESERLVAAKRVRATLLAGVAVPPATVSIANSWKPIGPSGVLRGQAGSQPTVSGRVSGIAVAADGRRVYAATASGGVWRSDDQGHRWYSLMDSINYDPLYRSIPGVSAKGVTTLSCGAIALDPRDPDKIFVGTGEAPGITYLGDGVLVSDDGGKSWTQEAHGGSAANSLTGAGFYALAVDPDPAQADFVFGATNIGLYKRQAKIGVAGFEWQRIAVPPLPANSRCTSVLVARRGGASHFFAALPNGGAGGQIFETWDQGAHWQRVGTGYPVGKNRIALAVFLDQGNAANQDVIYAINDDGQVHRAERISGFQGAWSGWTQVSGTPANIEKQGSYNRGFAIAPDNKNRLYIGGAWVWSNSEYSGFLYRCDISGSGTTLSMATTFLGNSIHPDLHTLVFAQNDPRQLWVGCDGGVFYTSNALAADNLDNLFRACNDGLQTLQFNSIGQHPGQEGVIIGGTQDNGALRYTGDEAWILSAGGDGGAAFINRADPTKFFSVYILNEYRISTSGGGRYSYSSKSVNTGYADDARINNMLFYPPYAYTPASTGAAGADLVAFGESKVWINTRFGDGDWQAITGNLGATISALAFATVDLIYAGTTNGLIFKIEKSGGTWQAPAALHASPTNFSYITSIAVHPAHNDRIYISLGGQGGSGTGTRVHYYDGTSWHDRTGTGGTGLLNSQINSLIIDPDTHDHLYVAADIGLWRSTNGGIDWEVFNNGLPETAIISLAVFKAAGHKKLLRAATHGRGMYEYTLDDAQALAIELYLRDHQLDPGREGGTSTYGDPDPTQPAINTAFGTSPDIRIDAPDSDGRYQFGDREELGFANFIGELTDNSDEVPVHRLPITSHVYVLVHNRGREQADGVTVVLLVSSAFAGDTPPQLPENYRLSLLANGRVENEDWTTVGSVALDDVRCANPRTARFNLPSDMLASGDNLEDGRKHALVAFVFHERDRLAGDERTVNALADSDRHVAVRYLTTSSFSGTLPGVEYGLERNVPFMLPVGVSMLACEKINRLADNLQAKQAAGGSVVFRDTDRRLLAMVLYSKSILSETEDIAAHRSLPCNGRFSRFVMMGCMGWNLADYVDWLSPEQGWIGKVLKRGSVDTDLSHRAVKSAEFVIRMAEIALAAAPDADKKKIRAFTLGMLHALAANVVMNPVLRGLQADCGPQDWDHDALTADEVACASYVSRQLLDSIPEKDAWINWWPESDAVPDSLFQGFQQALVEQYDPAAARTEKFGDHPDRAATDVPTAENLREGYDLFRRTLSPNLHWAWWLLILSPIFIMPSIALLIGRYGLDEGRKLFTEEHGDPDEKSYYELLSLTGFMSSVAPFAYSMYLWSLFPRQNGHFTQALIAGITRMLSGVFYGVSYGVSTPLPASVRWPVLGLTSGFDIWFLIRGIVHAVEDEPGYARLNFLQTVPAMSMLANLLFCGLMQIKRNDIAFWILWALWTAGAITGCVFSALAVARSDNLVSLLRNRRQQYIGMERLGRDTAYRPGKTFARVFDETSMWFAGDADREHQRYPSGPRALVTLVAPADSNWTFHSDGHRLTFKDNGGASHGPIELTDATSAAGLAAQITALVPTLTVTTVDSGDLLYNLPFPDAFSDPGDSCETHREHDAHQADYLPVSEDADKPTPVYHVPRSVIATSIGIPGSRCSSDERLRMLPAAPGNDFSGTVIDKAAELGALFSIAAAPVLHGGTVQAQGVTGSAAIHPVSQVFRRWNLSERHMAEWQTLFGSGAAAQTVDGSPEPPPAPAADGQPVRPDGAQVATGLGWIPTFAAWQEMAADHTQDSEAPDSMADIAALRLDNEPPLRPTNRDLSDALKYLLDL
ncbi:hypothetical protein FCL47_17750 [Desulfopila sp. IMCC35006]|uniref:hypothetical protein n=1 Tax=Desulfopila sp. IMCC35006 TaxID=2569542 RepID=UPI0010AC2078|nr:hypothetical protein [Desulfopila sp. IMCC35006]TKB24675.1 hypothetical protein FCL47_17750 [Desulfopila sp. IMCC35006]